MKQDRSSEVSKIDEIFMMGPQVARNPAGRTDSKPVNIEFPHSLLSSLTEAFKRIRGKDRLITLGAI